MSRSENLPVPARGTAVAVARVNGEERRVDELTLTQKATIIIAALGPVQAAGILKELGEANVRRFARSIATMGRIPAAVLDDVSAEFLNELGGDYDVSGGIVTARKILSEALDRDEYNRIMEDVQGSARLSLWDKLGNAPLGSMANFIAAEHPQIGAVILGRMRADKAARVLERLPAEVAQTVVLRMRRVPRVEHGVLEQVKTVIEEEFLSVIQRESGAKKPAELLAGLMNHVSGAAREQFLAQLEQDEPAFAAEVQRVMFTFGDILVRVVPRDVTQITREVEEETLMAALKTGVETNPRVVEFILGNLSRRLAERMQEDLDGMQAPPLKEGEAAQAELVKAIQLLAQRGAIRLNQPDAADDD